MSDAPHFSISEFLPESCHGKKDVYERGADSRGPDQTAHQRSLIRACPVRLLNYKIL